MTALPLRPPLPPHLQPNAKAASTAKRSQLSAVANTTPVASRSSSASRPARGKGEQPASGSDATAEKATLSLIRRVLAPDISHGPDARASPRPVEDVLPPLTSSNDVDVQLYAIIAVVVKDFVYAWYSKITPDQVFVEEVIHIIAHCSRALEQRLRQNDVAEVVLDEIPALVEQHVLHYRMAHENSTASEYGFAPLQIYHTLNPHPALSPIAELDSAEPPPEQMENEAIYRQLLVQGALAVLLPTEDLENASLRTLVGDIVADLILGQAVSGKICEGWFLHEAITKVVEIIKAHIEPKATGEELQLETRSRLEQFGLLSSKATGVPDHSSKRHQPKSSAWFWKSMQWAYLAFLFIRFVLMGMFQSRRLPARFRLAKSSVSSHLVTKSAENVTPHFPTMANPQARSVLTYRIFPFISTLLDLSTRMPWLVSAIAFGQNVLTFGAGRLGSTNSVLDKFIHNTIQTYVLTPSILSILLQNLRASIFPNNMPGPPASPPPSEVERLDIRRRAAEKILSIIPPMISRIFFNIDRDMSGEDGDQESLGQIEELLDVFSDKEMNKHLVYGIIELVILRLIPELGEKTPGALLAERVRLDERVEIRRRGGGWSEEDDHEDEDEDEEEDARMEAMKYFGDTV